MREYQPRLESRILANLPDASADERDRLLYALGKFGGSQASETYLLDSLRKSSPSTRQTVLQAIEVMRGASVIELYRESLRDRDLGVQLLALGILREHDRAGSAVPDVIRWVKRRLKDRNSRVIKDFAELPLALGYFSSAGELGQLAELLEVYSDQIDATDSRILDIMWPSSERTRWVQTGDGAAPDLTGLGRTGHPMGFYIRIESELDGEVPPAIPAGPSAEERERDLEEAHVELLETLAAIERRRT